MFRNIVPCRTRLLLASLLAGAVTGIAYMPLANAQTETSHSNRPNVLVILVDDMGYSDIGAFGSEIATPNLDRLASEGRVLSNFHASAACSPTRAMLMSGASHHQAGLGQMAEWTTALTLRGDGTIPLEKASTSDYAPFGSTYNFSNVPDGYAGILSEHALSLPEVLRDAGYNTYMAGKWHLSSLVGLKDSAPNARIHLHEPAMPHNRGFERMFALLPGGSSHFAPVPGKPIPMDRPMPHEPNGEYLSDGQLIESSSFPDDYYSTNYFTDKLIEFIGDTPDRQQPFFAYAAYTTPHWPLQAPASYIEAQKGNYDEGYEVIRERRLEKIKALGLLPEGFTPAPMLPSEAEGGIGMPKWHELTDEQRAKQARVMEVYAAMIVNLDDNLGRLFQHLKDINEYDNTMIVFMSDNGAEGVNFMNFMGLFSGPLGRNIDNSLDNLGHPLSMAEYGERWAEVSSTPFRMWKGHTGAEGGTRVPAIVKLPSNASDSSQSATPITGIASILDIFPTVLDLAQIDNPGTEYQGRTVYPLAGVSLLDALNQSGDHQIRGEDEVLIDELFFRTYVRKGKWKLSRNPEVETPGSDLASGNGGSFRPLDSVPWKLFDMQNDPTETTDLAAEYPEVVDELLKHWQTYVKEKNVIMSDNINILPRGADPRLWP